MVRQGATIAEMVFLIIAIVILLVALLTFGAQAQELASMANSPAMQNYTPEKLSWEQIFNCQYHGDQNFSGIFKGRSW
jgi:hypothetical protein